MKTLVVLSALVCLTSAAPTLEGKHTTTVGTNFKNHQQPIKREKKSPQDSQFDTLPVSTSVGLNAHQLAIEPEIELPTPSARSFGFKKGPIVVKSHRGYHVYRDSTEERAAADPEVSCAKQLRVKVCDETNAKSADIKRSINNDDLHNEDFESSIKIAKEAVESLQRDINNTEGDSKAKSAQWKHGKEADKEGHDNLDDQRLVINEAHNNFGNLESMNLHATMSKDTEALHESIGKSEEERLAQWKTAMENIQRNVEIARNIEDSLRFSGHNFMAAEAIDTTKMMKNSNHEESTDIHKMPRNAEHTLEDASSKFLDTKVKHNEKFTLNHELEMKSAASEMMETKVLQPTTNTNHKHNNLAKSSDTTLVTKNNDFEILRSAVQDQKSLSQDMINEKATIDNQHHHHDKFLPLARSSNNKQISSETKVEKASSKTSILESNNVGVKSKAHSDSLVKVLHTKVSDNHEKGKNAWERTDESKVVEHENMALHSSLNKDHKENEHSMKSAEHVPEHKLTSEDFQKLKSSLHSNTKASNDAASKVKLNSKGLLNVNVKPDIDISLGKTTHEKTAETGNEFNVEQTRHTEMLEHHHHSHMMHEQMHHHHHHGMDKDHMPNLDVSQKSKISLHSDIRASDDGTHTVGHESKGLLDIKIKPDVEISLGKTKHGKTAETDNNLNMEQARHTEMSEHHHHRDMMHEQMHHHHHHDMNMHHMPTLDVSQKSKISLHSEMRASDNATHAVGHKSKGLLDIKIKPDVELSLGKTKNGKAADTDNDLNMEQTRHTEMLEHHHHPHMMHEEMHHHHHHGMDMHHNHEHSGHPSHLSHMHMHSMGHGKSAEVDFAMAPSTHMSMRESALEDFMQWKHHGEAARSSYGSPYSLGAGGSYGGPGAVGVFPNAKVGGCAIPLLLGCSPSVVHGSLVKSHSGYSAPAYRAKDNSNIKTKRGILKAKELPEGNVKSTPVDVMKNTLDKNL